MKKQVIALMTVLAVACAPLFAQTTTPAAAPTKIGYTNVDFILGKLPESKKIQNELEITKAQLDKALSDKYKEFQEKLDNYNKAAAGMADVLRTDKEKELQNLQNSIQELQRNSETSLQNKYQQLIEPVLTKINTAIQEVGKANNYLYILNSDAGANTTPILLYVGSEDNNVTDLVLKQLGVDPKAGETPAAPAPATAPKK
ncbi:OmpH family outer membrane protein [Arundinibacter roseus]|uniref:OmpH family outer membrane protein n=1 Tax=Arundinibacter roseus TaxID=2070510 RepID=A0A4R4K7F5_9BACT|nr:OmpH family outer membrane protein [Arundinibacter roseus]TDB63410.1 OmpH family outer membrane protein [Arundinibacter roseus]